MLSLRPEIPQQHYRGNCYNNTWIYKFYFIRQKIPREQTKLTAIVCYVDCSCLKAVSLGTRWFFSNQGRSMRQSVLFRLISCNWFLSKRHYRSETKVAILYLRSKCITFFCSGFWNPLPFVTRDTSQCNNCRSLLLLSPTFVVDGRKFLSPYFLRYRFVCQYCLPSK
jgi:hypothetical protein